MFFAALMSRSCRAPQDGHCHVRVLRLRSASRCPHAEQVFELGYQRSTAMTVRPWRWALYSSMDRNSAQPVQEIARASRRLRTMPATFRSSTAITSFSRTRRVLALCRKSRRASATLACALATLTARFTRFADPRWHRASLRCHRFSCRSCRSQFLGCGTFSPVDSTAKWARPTSIPTLWPAAGSGAGPGASTWNVTNHRPAGSRATVTDVGSTPAGSTSGHDQTNLSGALILARRSTPSFILNAARV